MCYGALLLVAYMCLIVISSWWIDPFTIIKYPSLSLVTFLFVLKSILSDTCIATPTFFLIVAVCMIHVFLFFYFQSFCVFEFKACLL